MDFSSNTEHPSGEGEGFTEFNQSSTNLPPDTHGDHASNDEVQPSFQNISPSPLPGTRGYSATEGTQQRPLYNAQAFGTPFIPPQSLDTWGPSSQTHVPHYTAGRSGSAQPDDTQAMHSSQFQPFNHRNSASRTSHRSISSPPPPPAFNTFSSPAQMSHYLPSAGPGSYTPYVRAFSPMQSRKTDDFVAIDPYRHDTLGKDEEDIQNFDEVPIVGPSGINPSNSWWHVPPRLNSTGSHNGASPYVQSVQTSDSHATTHDEMSSQSEIPPPSTTNTSVSRFFREKLPRQIYSAMLLYLPSLYFSRVARIFIEADVTLPKLKVMALEMGSLAKGQFNGLAFESVNYPMPPQYERLKTTWETFIDSVMREWKTFNVISALLLSAILTILQIESAANDPVTRYFALGSMICALVSLLYGCMYIIRFGSMRKTYKAAEWALQVQRKKTVIWWNVWVLLAMPAVWLTWSIIFYIICIMSFIWRTSPFDDSSLSNNISKTGILSIRVVISSVMAVGMIYGGLILNTFRSYGEPMDRKWKERIDSWIESKKIGSNPMPFGHAPYPGPTPFTNPVPPQPYNDYYSPSYGFPGPDHAAQSAEESSSFRRSYWSYDATNRVPSPPIPSPPIPSPPHNSPTSPGIDNPESGSSTAVHPTSVNAEYNRDPHLRQESGDSYDNSASSMYQQQGDLDSGLSRAFPLPPKNPVPRPGTGRIPRQPNLAVPPPWTLPPIPGTPLPDHKPMSSTVGKRDADTRSNSRSTNHEGTHEHEAYHHRIRFEPSLILGEGSVGSGSPSNSQALVSRQYHSATIGSDQILTAGND